MQNRFTPFIFSALTVLSRRKFVSTATRPTKGAERLPTNRFFPVRNRRRLGFFFLSAALIATSAFAADEYPSVSGAPTTDVATFAEPTFEPASLYAVDDPSERSFDSGLAADATPQPGFAANISSATANIGRMYRGANVDFDLVSGDFGFVGLGANATFGFPSPKAGHFVLATPSFRWRQYDVPDWAVGSDSLGIISTGATFNYVIPKSERWTFNVALGLNWNSDGKSTNSEGLNVFGSGVGLWTYSERLKWAFGLAYTNSGDYDIFPIIGATWKPNELWVVDLMFPAPKVSRKIERWSRSDATYWGYLGFAFDANDAVFETDWGTDARLERSDVRLSLGVEKKAEAGLRWAAELGTTFSRDFDVESLEGRYWRADYSPDAALYFKTKFAF